MNSINVAIAHIKPKRFLGMLCRTEKEYRLRERWYQEPLRPAPGQTPRGEKADFKIKYGKRRSVKS